MNPKDLATYARNTWCPGCGNFSILNAMRAVLAELDGEGYPIENVVLVSGIGCHAKIVDYLNVNSFYSIHGRTLPVATAIKLANPDLKVICFSGDGDSLAEGLDHLVFAAKRNIDVTLILHDNRVFGLTTGQYTPTSPKGFRGKSTPQGSDELPMNPAEIMLVCGATYIARGYTHGIDLLQRLFKEAIVHKGFSFVDVLQVCVSYFNMYEAYNKRTYEVKGNDTGSFEEAQRIIRSWNYDGGEAPIPLGKFYETDAPRLDQAFLDARPKDLERHARIKVLLENFI
ncbi:MAG: 2-oxoacid:ferredoxin oxidoreductase subunit beta [Methanothrix sp.]|jgi:2-oxoglutarate ferredoxin oxidoreductase subunit beta|nr:2-oxoacid:ferredoxin oxidoreductase subunit beta [Methanothrix sp.]OPY45739.1 MAG: 2-oxoglutarate synthase subunit KorB [Methanosaeta sp. PtaU1.Bin016]